MKGYKFGWKPDLPDARDHLYDAGAVTLRRLPAAVDLRPQFTFPVYDQGQIGSCTANAIAAAIEFSRDRAGQLPPFTPSRLFIYYNERAKEKTVQFDAGAQIRDGVKSANKFGVCSESAWQYSDLGPAKEGDPWPAAAPAGIKPPAFCYAEASLFQVVRYLRLLQSVRQLKACLADGFPFVFGFTVYDSIYGADGNPVINVPVPGGKDSAIGGHAVLAVGYDDFKDHFIVRNSWGPDAQDHGHFYLPYAYLTDRNLADDFWVIRTVEA